MAGFRGRLSFDSLLDSVHVPRPGHDFDDELVSIESALVDLPLGGRLDALRHLIEDVCHLVHPAPLLTRAREDFLEAGQNPSPPSATAS
jgi:hypothetical protein